MMFSGFPFHSGTRVTSDSSTALTTCSGGSSAQTVTISVRWIMTSETVRSRRSRSPLNMSRSSLSTPPVRCKRSTAPRSSSWGERIDSISPTFMPASRSTHFTSHSTVIRTGASTRTVQSIGRATASAMRLGALKAAVFGKTSANTTITMVMTTVA